MIVEPISECDLFAEIILSLVSNLCCLLLLWHTDVGTGRAKVSDNKRVLASTTAKSCSVKVEGASTTKYDENATAIAPIEK